jgi:hypothetical protein
MKLYLAGIRISKPKVLKMISKLSLSARIVLLRLSLEKELVLKYPQESYCGFYEKAQPNFKKPKWNCLSPWKTISNETLL